ncbi:hypothetical protein GGS21DRAFT_487659 [Xylaria nigripes]|nr:hypothetical protein GGS21DRAFT_487659 [Xylaria nigripes]
MDAVYEVFRKAPQAFVALLMIAMLTSAEDVLLFLGGLLGFYTCVYTIAPFYQDLFHIHMAYTRFCDIVLDCIESTTSYFDPCIPSFFRLSTQSKSTLSVSSVMVTAITGSSESPKATMVDSGFQTYLCYLPEKNDSADAKKGTQLPLRWLEEPWLHEHDDFNAASSPPYPVFPRKSLLAPIRSSHRVCSLVPESPALSRESPFRPFRSHRVRSLVPESPALSPVNSPAAAVDPLAAESLSPVLGSPVSGSANTSQDVQDTSAPAHILESNQIFPPKSPDVSTVAIQGPVISAPIASAPVSAPDLPIVEVESVISSPESVIVSTVPIVTPVPAPAQESPVVMTSPVPTSVPLTAFSVSPAPDSGPFAPVSVPALISVSPGQSQFPSDSIPVAQVPVSDTPTPALVSLPIVPVNLLTFDIESQALEFQQSLPPPSIEKLPLPPVPPTINHSVARPVGGPAAAPPAPLETDAGHIDNLSVADADNIEVEYKGSPQRAFGAPETNISAWFPPENNGAMDLDIPELLLEDTGEDIDWNFDNPGIDGINISQVNPTFDGVNPGKLLPNDLYPEKMDFSGYDSGTNGRDPKEIALDRLNSNDDTEMEDHLPAPTVDDIMVDNDDSALVPVSTRLPLDMEMECPYTDFAGGNLVIQDFPTLPDFSMDMDEVMEVHTGYVAAPVNNSQFVERGDDNMVLDDEPSDQLQDMDVEMGVEVKAEPIDTEIEGLSELLPKLVISSPMIHPSVGGFMPNAANIPAPVNADVQMEGTDEMEGSFVPFTATAVRPQSRRVKRPFGGLPPPPSTLFGQASLDSDLPDAPSSAAMSHTSNISVNLSRRIRIPVRVSKALTSNSLSSPLKSPVMFDMSLIPDESVVNQRFIIAGRSTQPMCNIPSLQPGYQPIHVLNSENRVHDARLVPYYDNSGFQHKVRWETRGFAPFDGDRLRQTEQRMAEAGDEASKDWPSRAAGIAEQRACDKAAYETRFKKRAEEKFRKAVEALERRQKSQKEEGPPVLVPRKVQKEEEPSRSIPRKKAQKKEGPSMFIPRKKKRA